MRLLPKKVGIDIPLVGICRAERGIQRLEAVASALLLIPELI
jgi:hypothetical protein